MAKRANPTLIGAFVVGAVLLAVAGILAFGRSSFFQREYKMVAHFQSSVKGLDVGAPVLFQGVRVGRVSGVHAEWNRDQEIRVPVELTFVPDSVHAAPDSAASLDRHDEYAFMQELIGRGLRGELRLDSLVTGKLYVSLDFFPGDQPRFVGHTEYPELPTVESGFLRIQKELEKVPTGEILAKTLDAIETVDDLVTSGKLEELVESYTNLAKAIEAQVVPLSESVQETLAQARGTMVRLEDRAGEASDSVKMLMTSADGEVRDVSASLQGFIGDADARVGPLAEALTATLADARAALAGLDDVLGDDPTMLYRTAAALEELAAAARSIRQLADYLERHPEALISGKKK